MSNNTFYILSFMLNYDIICQSTNIKNLDNLLDLIKDSDLDLVNPDLLVAKFFEYTQWKGINPNDAYEIFINNFESSFKTSTSSSKTTSLASTEPVEQFAGFLQIHGDKSIIFKPFNRSEIQPKINYLLNNNLLGKKLKIQKKKNQKFHILVYLYQIQN